MVHRTVLSAVAELGVNGSLLNELKAKVSFDLNKSPKELTQKEIRELFGLI